MIKKRDMLFEMGVEELPPSYIEPALECLVEYLCKSLTSKNLTFGEIIRYSTPRRLAVRINSIPEKQQDVVEEKMGPAVRIAYNPDGSLSKAGQGFIRSSDITEEQIEIKKTAKGEYISAMISRKGEESRSILNTLLPEAIKSIRFPKMMYWNSRNVTFARPVRWLLVIYGSEIVDFEYNGIRANRLSYGNVLTTKGKSVVIDSPDRYEAELEKELVIVNREKRKQIISNQIEQLCATVDALLMPDSEELLEEVTNIVEFPTPLLASFHEYYLKLPERIITSTLAKNQKYFALYSRDSRHAKMRNDFIFVANNHPDYAPNSRAGNERVVKARLDDALFYLEEDHKKDIDNFNQSLSRMVFHASLGTIKEKVERIEKVSSYIADKLDIDEQKRTLLSRTAAICKFDLATNMIAEKEFSGLQGYIGKVYAEYFGEMPEVAEAIEEHYRPLSFNDTLPETLPGMIVALADKIDSLCALFSIGKIPTGSNDPFALRRAGNGIVRILYDRQLPVRIVDLVDYSSELVLSELSEKDSLKKNTPEGAKHRGKPLDKEVLGTQIMQFLRQRIEWLLEQYGVDYDIVNSLLVSGVSDMVRLRKKVEALSKLRERANFEKLVISFKRVANIISAAERNGIGNRELLLEKSLLKEEAEVELYQALLSIEEKGASLLDSNDFENLLKAFISIKDNIDCFFDKVMVNVEDKDLRFNRYALLQRIKNLFLHVGDLSLIVIEGENSPDNLKNQQ